MIAPGRAAYALPLICCAAVLMFGCAKNPQQKQAEYLKRGKKSLAAKDYRRAALEFRNAIQANPKEAEPHYQLALADLGMQDFRGAVSSLFAAVNRDPKHFAAQLKLAELMLTSTEQTRLEEAAGRVREVLANSPDNPDALNVLALAELKLGKPKDAEAHLSDAFEKAPHSLTPAFNLVRLKLNQRDVAGAEADLKAIVSNNPKSESALFSLAEFYVLTRRPAEAEHWFRSTLTVQPNSGPALLGLAELLQVQGKAADAEELYRRASALPDPEYRPMHAIYLYQSGRRDQAIKEFEDLYRRNPSDRSARARLVAAYQINNRGTDAEKIWRDALKQNPHDMDALLQRSQSYLLAGNAVQAEADLNTVIRFQPDSAEAHYLLSKVYRRRGEAATERAQLMEAITREPDFLQARLDLARQLIATNSAQAALDILENVPRSQENVLAVLEYRSWAQLAIGQRTEARKTIDRALKVTRTRGLLLLDATSRLVEGNAAQARSSAEEALAKNPEDTAALNLLVQSYTQQHQASAALEAIHKYADAKPGSALLQHFLGQLLLQMGKKADARNQFQRVVSAHPTFLPAVLDLALMDVTEGKIDDAERALSPVAESNIGSLKVQLLLGVVEEHKKNYAEAVGHYRRAMELDDHNMMALNNLAYILAEYANQPDEALKFAQKAGEVAPDNPAVQDTLGWVFYRKGMYSNAIKYLEQAASKQPDGTVQFHLGSAYVRGGERKRGVQMLRSALALDPGLARSKSFQELMSAAATQ